MTNLEKPQPGSQKRAKRQKQAIASSVQLSIIFWEVVWEVAFKTAENNIFRLYLAVIKRSQ